MLRINNKQYDALSSRYQESTLIRICKHIACNDIGTSGGRSHIELLPYAEKAVKIAESMGLKSVGAVALITQFSLLLETSPDLLSAIQPLLNILKDNALSEEVRLHQVNRILYDLEVPVPDEVTHD
jgi:hypothetical protein